MTGTTVANATTADDFMSEIRLEVAAALLDPDDGLTLDAMPEDEQACLLDIAQRAIDAHRKCMSERGFRMTPPGTFAAPSCEQEAKAMVSVGQAYLDAAGRKKKLLTSPGLVIPGRMQ